MRPAPALLLFLFLGCFGSLTAAQVAALQVTDASAPDSPIHISGSLIVARSAETSPRCELVHAPRCTVTSTQRDITLRNVSGRAIVAFVVEIGGRSWNGDFYSNRTWQSENIFGALFTPGASEPWRDAGGIEITPLGPGDEPFAPASEARVVFAQFDDGTMFGNQKAGEKLLLMRQQSLESLAQLDAIYTRQGEQAFEKAARQPNAGAMMGIAQFDKEDGPAATIARIRRMLATAKERLAAMTAQPGR